MEKGSDIYFDPLSEVNETHRRITLLPDHFTDDMKLNMKKIYAHQSLTPPFTSNILEELTPKEANHILMKSCPKELAKSAIGFGLDNHNLYFFYNYYDDNNIFVGN